MTDITTFLNSLRKQKKLQDIDLAFADLVDRAAGTPGNPALKLLAALVSNSLSQRNETALPAERIASGNALAEYLHLPPGTELPIPADGWLPGTGLCPELLSGGERPTPLVLRNGLFYIGRCFQEEIFLRDFLLRHAGSAAETAEDGDQFGSLTDLELGEEQIRAIRLARNTHFLTICGGPGTGKTTIIAMILALRKEKPDEIVLCAPTGKAQMRMKQSLNHQLGALHTDPARIAELTGIASSTIHRLLGWDPQKCTFRHNRENPLPYSLVIVDEGSMIPASLMKSLLAAVPETASLILLGDRFQLDSVEPGSVFGDFCDILKKCPGRLAELTVSHRFRDDQGIGSLKNLINAGEAEAALDLLKRGGNPQLSCLPLPKKKDLPDCLRERFEGTWITGKIPYYKEETLEKAWERFEQFRILTPVNSGPFGTENLNRQARLVLGFDDEAPQAGEAILILRNDYQVRLFNGDTGLVWYAGPDGKPLSRDAAQSQTDVQLLVFFPDIAPNGDPAWHGIPLNNLPEHTHAYAFTIHKSQGSDYDRILILLPEMEDDQRDLLNRSLLYTGITRAKKHVSAAFEPKTFLKAVRQTTSRTSGLPGLYEEAVKNPDC